MDVMAHDSWRFVRAWCFGMRGSVGAEGVIMFGMSTLIIVGISREEGDYYHDVLVSFVDLGDSSEENN